MSSSGPPARPHRYPRPQEYGAAYPPPMPPVPPLVPHGPGYGAPPGESARSWAVGALVTNVALTMLCCTPLSIAGIVVSALAMGRAGHEPEPASLLLRWAWGLAMASVLLGIVLIAVVVALIVTNQPP